MPIFEKLKNIFGSHGQNNLEGKRKAKFPYIKQDSDPNELWEIVGELGDGAFGKVYKAKHKETSILAALKQVDINEESDLDDYSVEIDILNLCHHKNIVGLHEAYLFNSKLWMFIEFCEMGALDGIMMELEKPLTEPQIKFICHEMCEALEFLHQNFVIHRDLKAGNVLLTHDGNVRLADFGVSARNTSYRQKRDEFIGTPYWMAPEVILCETIKDSPYDFKADIWSFGITLIEFAQIEPPNNEIHPMRVLMKITKSESPTLNQPSKWSKEFNDFIAKCLVKDPEKRPTAGELLHHPFIKDVRDNRGISDLCSEVNAEIILEEKDIDDEMEASVDLDSPTDGSISSAGSDRLNPSAPKILVDESPKKEADAAPQTAPEAERKFISKRASEQKENNEGSGDGQDVVLRKRKDKPMDIIEEDKESSDSPTQRKKYKTLTKTRRFVVNGEEKISVVKRIISSGSETEDEKLKEHRLWKADLRELKLLHRLENKQLQDLEIKSNSSTEEQNRKLDLDMQNLVHSYELSLDQLSKQHRQLTEKMCASQTNDKKNLQKKMRSDQDRELKVFMEGLKQDMKLMRQEVEMLPKEARKDALQQRKEKKEAEQTERQRKFQEQQQENLERALKRQAEQQREQTSLSEKQFLQQQQQIVRSKEAAVWDLEERQLKERNQLEEQLLKNKFILMRQLMMQRHSKEMEQIKRINTYKEDELLQCHAQEWKRLPKILKSDGKTRQLMFKESIRISSYGISLEQEKEKLKQFEEAEKARAREEKHRLETKHKRQLEELRVKNGNLVKELEQVHADKQKLLLDNETQKITELQNAYKAKLSDWKDQLIPRKEAMEVMFKQQMAEQEKFYTEGSEKKSLAALVQAGSALPVAAGDATETKQSTGDANQPKSTAVETNSESKVKEVVTVKNQVKPVDGKKTAPSGELGGHRSEKVVATEKKDLPKTDVVVAAVKTEDVSEKVVALEKKDLPKTDVVVAAVKTEDVGATENKVVPTIENVEKVVEAVEGIECRKGSEVGKGLAAEVEAEHKVEGAVVVESQKLPEIEVEVKVVAASDCHAVSKSEEIVDVEGHGVSKGDEIVAADVASDAVPVAIGTEKASESTSSVQPTEAGFVKIEGACVDHTADDDKKASGDCGENDPTEKEKSSDEHVKEDEEVRQSAKGVEIKVDAETKVPHPVGTEEEGNSSVEIPVIIEVVTTENQPMIVEVEVPKVEEAESTNEGLDVVASVNVEKEENNEDSNNPPKELECEKDGVCSPGGETKVVDDVNAGEQDGVCSPGGETKVVDDVNAGEQDGVCSPGEETKVVDDVNAGQQDDESEGEDGNFSDSDFQTLDSKPTETNPTGEETPAAPSTVSVGDESIDDPAVSGSSPIAESSAAQIPATDEELVPNDAAAAKELVDGERSTNAVSCLDSEHRASNDLTSEGHADLDAS